MERSGRWVLTRGGLYEGREKKGEQGTGPVDIFVYYTAAAVGCYYTPTHRPSDYHRAIRETLHVDCETFLRHLKAAALLEEEEKLTFFMAGGHGTRATSPITLTFLTFCSAVSAHNTTKRNNFFFAAAAATFLCSSFFTWSDRIPIVWSDAKKVLNYLFVCWMICEAGRELASRLSKAHLKASPYRRRLGRCSEATAAHNWRVFDTNRSIGGGNVFTKINAARR